MPERGQVHRPADQGPVVDARTGQPAKPPPDWVPYARAPVAITMPSDIDAGRREVVVLPRVGALGPDYVFEEYAYVVSRRLETSKKSYVLAEGDDYASVARQTGGVPRIGVLVMQLVGDPHTTEAGPTYDTTPCFRFRLDVGANGQPEIAVTGAIGWLVHHPQERAPRLDHDWQMGPPPPGQENATAPALEVRLDLATRSGTNVYAPRFEVDPSAFGHGPTPQPDPVPPVARTYRSEDVLPRGDPPRRGRFGRGR